MKIVKRKVALTVMLFISTLVICIFTILQFNKIEKLQKKIQEYDEYSKYLEQNIYFKFKII